MPLDITSLPKGPETQTLHFDSNAEVVDERDPEAVFSLKIQYMSDRERQEYYDHALRRLATDKKGGKQIASMSREAERKIARHALRDWNMTVAGLYALGYERDLSGQAKNEVVPFAQKYVESLLDESKLLGVITGVLDDRRLWFDAPGSEADKDAEGNSETGPSGSSA